MSSMPPFLASAMATCLAAQDKLLKPDDRLDRAVANSKKNGLPEIAVSPAHGQMLSILCQLMNAKSVLEIGTLGAYSTIWFATSVPGIKVTSVEFNPKHRDVALQNLAGLDNTEVILGAALDVLPKLADEGKVFDFVFIDADWDEQTKYFDRAVKMTRKGGAVYVDNAVRQLTETEEGDPRGHALIEHVKNDDRVDATLIPTLITFRKTMVEATDGFLLAIVK